MYVAGIAYGFLPSSLTSSLSSALTSTLTSTFTSIPSSHLITFFGLPAVLLCLVLRSLPTWKAFWRLRIVNEVWMPYSVYAHQFSPVVRMVEFTVELVFGHACCTTVMWSVTGAGAIVLASVLFMKLVTLFRWWRVQALGFKEILLTELKETATCQRDRSVHHVGNVDKRSPARISSTRDVKRTRSGRRY
jgi:hypothetical protein